MSVFVPDINASYIADSVQPTFSFLSMSTLESPWVALTTDPSDLPLIPQADFDLVMGYVDAVWDHTSESGNSSTLLLLLETMLML